MKIFGIETKDLEKSISNLRDLSYLRAEILSYVYPDDYFIGAANEDFFRGYNQGISDCIKFIDDIINGGDVGV